MHLYSMEIDFVSHCTTTIQFSVLGYFGDTLKTHSTLLFIV